MIDLISNAISTIVEQIEDSNKKLEYLDGPERTRELYHNGNLQLELRKATIIANRNGNFFCSACGKRFKDRELRDKHSYNTHIQKEVL